MSVVVGYVPTATGFRAVREAEREARSLQVPIVLVNVIGARGYSVPTAADEKSLDAVAAYLREAGVEFSVEQVTGNDAPDDVILAIAARIDAQLIVLGLHRRSRVQKALLGSTTQSVMLSAECPVLTVPHVDD